MERIAQALGDYVVDGTQFVQFTVPASAKAGDQLVILIMGRPATQTAQGSLNATCAGWTLEAAEKSGVDYYNEGVLLSKEATSSDAGSTVRVGVTTLIDGASQIGIGGVLVVYRGGVLPALAERVDSFKVLDFGSVTSHAAPATEGTQAEDRRLTVWYVVETGTIAEASGTGITSLGQFQDNTADVTAAEHLNNAPGTAGAMTVVASTARKGGCAAACLRARAIARPSGLPTSRPGACGFEQGAT